MDLTKMSCMPCRKGEAPLLPKEIAEYFAALEGWDLIEVEGVSRLHKTYAFGTYLAGLAFTNRVAELAEAQQHHPEIVIEWKKVQVSWWTHVVDGLHRNDFISAAKTDDIFKFFIVE